MPQRQRAYLPLALLLLAQCCAGAAWTTVNLIPDGSFESLPDASLLPDGCDNYGSNYAYGCPDTISVAMPPWHVDGKLDVQLGIQSSYINCSDGTRCIDLNSNIAYPGAGVNAPLQLTGGETYRFTLDIGGNTANCGCGTVPILDGLIEFSTSKGAAPFASSTCSIDLSDGVCRWGNYTVDITVPTNDVFLNITSLVPPNWCGLWIDNVRLFWIKCVDGSQPPSAGSDYSVTCGDGWILTPPANPAPITVTTPIYIDGNPQVTQLNITIGTSATAPFVVVNGTAVLSGVLNIELGDLPVQSGDRIDVLNATSISGAFTSVEVTRNGTKDCTGADLAQNGGLLTALITYDCKGAYGHHLKGWHIGLIVLGAFLFVALAAAVVFGLFGVRKQRKRRPSTRSTMYAGAQNVHV